MSASLVGSEMCIRDRIRTSEANGGAIHGPRVRKASGERGAERRGARELTAAGRGVRRGSSPCPSAAGAHARRAATR
eukprot:3597153-Alexandrium_andersonii.AAC.1